MISRNIGHWLLPGWVLLFALFASGLGLDGPKAQESGAFHTVEGADVPDGLLFELLAANKDNSDVGQVMTVDAKLGLASVALTKREPAGFLFEIGQTVAERHFRLDGDLIEFLFRVNGSEDLVGLAQKPSLLVPTADIGNADVKERIERGDQLVVFLDRKLKNQLRDGLDLFDKRTQDLGGNISPPSLAESLAAMKPISQAWMNALDARQMPFSIQSLEGLSQQFATLNEIVSRILGGSASVNDVETAADIAADGRYQASFLGETLGSSANPAGGTRMEMKIEVRLWADLPMTRPQSGITIFYSKPYQTDPRQFRRAGLSSPVNFSAMYGIYCIWAEEPVGTIVSEVAMWQPPNHFDDDAQPLDLIYLGKRAQKSPNRCQQ
ncbi:hypothetical protein QA644_33745 (plasmid) [Rhizobium sp. CC1099]|uniref:hypothetical protein n=1 Tax=Rhizobium sp. CC1099 TaxID=3039160 RepID=UPI0024B09C2B|nr:hypothetical protein [Rhizobium sp. CC1099]WFU92160.1 hypothetical protein QA644_33745 [Rhizobium sp. CC1099]